MSSYDYIVDSDGHGFGIQLKCWNRECQAFKLGDSVPNVHGCDSYSIDCDKQPSLFVNVNHGVITSLSPEPEQTVVFNRYGEVGPAINPVEEALKTANL